MMLARFLYPMHADPRDFGLYPWLEVLRDTERGFVCACCGVKQLPLRPMVFVPAVVEHTGDASMCRLAQHTMRPWCVSCAWKLCGRKMVTRRRWWRVWG